MKENRSSNYREKYISHHPPRDGGYMCVYCGRWVTVTQMEVDHVFPVARTQNRLLKRMLLKGSVNDLSNLTSACKRCNRKKGHKMGLWYLRGRYWHVFLHIYMIGLLLFRLSMFFALWDVFAWVLPTISQ